MNKIRIEIKMFMKFKKYLPSDSLQGRAIMSLDEGSTLEDLMKVLGIPADEPGGAVINGVFQGIECSQTLKDGDVVSFFAPVAGG